MYLLHNGVDKWTHANVESNQLISMIAKFIQTDPDKWLFKGNWNCFFF